MHQAILYSRLLKGLIESVRNTEQVHLSKSSIKTQLVLAAVVPALLVAGLATTGLLVVALGQSMPVRTQATVALLLAPVVAVHHVPMVVVAVCYRR